MNDIQKNELSFYLPVVIGYAAACFTTWFIYKKAGIWNVSDTYKPKHPWKEILLGLAAVLVVFVIGRLYTAGFLIPGRYNPIAWVINNIIIYSPVFIVILVRKHSLNTIWLNKKSIGIKLLAGFLSAFISVSLFLFSRNEWSRWHEVLQKVLSLDGSTYFLATFLEGITLAFVFVRLNWLFKLRITLAVPAILFALAHVPGMISDGDTWWYILLMSAVTGTITVFVLYTCYKSKDIIWIGVVHYVMDAAIRSF